MHVDIWSSTAWAAPAHVGRSQVPRPCCGCVRCAPVTPSTTTGRSISRRSRAHAYVMLCGRPSPELATRNTRRSEKPHRPAYPPNTLDGAASGGRSMKTAKRSPSSSGDMPESRFYFVPIVRRARFVDARVGAAVSGYRSRACALSCRPHSPGSMQPHFKTVESNFWAARRRIICWSRD